MGRIGELITNIIIYHFIKIHFIQSSKHGKFLKFPLKKTCLIFWGNFPTEIEKIPLSKISIHPDHEFSFFLHFPLTINFYQFSVFYGKISIWYLITGFSFIFSTTFFNMYINNWQKTKKVILSQLFFYPFILPSSFLLF